MNPEVFVALPKPRAQLPPVKEVRTTLVTASIQALRQRGRFEAYERHLLKEHRESVLTCIAGGWLPLPIAFAHYNALDALGLTPSEVAELGSDVSRRTNTTFLSTITKLATSSGVTPWTGLSHMDRLYARVLNGGGVEVLKLGPKEAQIDFVGVPLVRIPYFRQAFRSFVQTAGAQLSHRFFTREMSRLSSSTNLVLLLSWV